ncbi:MAG: hypothetical protein AAFN09_10150 [Pseudomonadota bacterium]
MSFGDWWLWGVAAVILAVGEVLLPSFILLGFAIGAGVIGFLLLIGVPLAANVPLMFLIFAVISLVAWIGLRRAMGVTETQVKTFDRDINDD